MSNTQHLKLPLLQERQAHKHITLNESLQILDVLTQLAVESLTLTEPPNALSGAQEKEGAAYIVAPNATSAWENKDNQIAVYQNGAWLFIEPREGFSAWNKADNKRYTYYNSTWHEA